MRITKNLSFREVIRSNTAERRNIKNIPNKEQLSAIKNLAESIFQPMRDHFGEPIRINSFFRSKTLNQAIGGSVRSQHCKGEAMDIDATNKTSNKELFNYIKNNLEFDQLIWEFGTDENPSWIHVSLKHKGINRKEILKAFKLNNKTIYKNITHE